MKKLNIPNENDWTGYKNDLDLVDMHRLFYSKSIDDTFHYFKNGASISRADELLFANKKVFQYYIFSFLKYLLSEIGRNDAEATEVFLSLLLAREKRDPGSVSDIYYLKVPLNIDGENKEISIANALVDIKNRECTNQERKENQEVCETLYKVENTFSQK